MKKKTSKQTMVKERRTSVSFVFFFIPFSLTCYHLALCVVKERSTLFEAEIKAGLFFQPVFISLSLISLINLFFKFCFCFFPFPRFRCASRIFIFSSLVVFFKFEF